MEQDRYVQNQPPFPPLIPLTGFSLDLHHECMSMLLGGELHLAPVSSPHRILDIGTGTGIWAIDMADRYPMAEVTGTDLRKGPFNPSSTLALI